MPKYRYTVSYEIVDAELVIIAESEQDADRLLDSKLALLTPCETTGGTLVNAVASEVEEVE